MIFLPKKSKQVPAIKQIRLNSTPGGKIVITGDGYLNFRRVGLMTADKKNKLYLFANPKGYTVQHCKTTWSVPIHIKGLTSEQAQAIKPYIDKGALKATIEQFKYKDGCMVPVVCIKAPEVKPMTDTEIMDLLQLIRQNLKGGAING